MPLTLLPARRKRRKRHRSQELPSTAAFLLRQREPGKKISEEKGERPRVSWPVALRAVRGWLEPWIMALALLEWLVASAPTACVAVPAQLACTGARHLILQFSLTLVNKLPISQEVP